MKAKEIRERFINFFAKRGHVVIPSAPLVPENDPSVLFNTAGVQPLVPYLLGQPHPAGKRLVNIQKCVRTQDIDEVGDKTHDTFFQMLGNWSLGDYFKTEAITWSYELLTSKTEGFGLDPERLYITCFAGDENAPRDDESAALWKKIGIPEKRIYFLPAGDNWWSAGDNGPCGPDTEMHYDITKNGLGDLSLEEFKRAADETQEIIEVWNDVFMEYEKKDGQVIGKLVSKNVDTGAGLERLAMALQGKNNIFETDLFSPIMAKINQFAPTADERAKRIVADHLRTAVFLIADGVMPSNTDRGYVLRRLLRRAIRYADRLNLPAGALEIIIATTQDTYREAYPNIADPAVKKIIREEETKFRQTLERGLKEVDRVIEKSGRVSGHDAFIISSTLGIPVELTSEIAKEKGKDVDMVGYEEEVKKHQEQSRRGAQKKFKGGLADTTEQSIKYHTATHLLHQALHDVLGPAIEQRGSNITPDRLRFDFTHPTKLTEKEKEQVEVTVNQKIKQNLPVQVISLPRAAAEKSGARHFFGDKYGEVVTVYYIGNDLPTAYSKEFCGGPHVGSTGVLGHFKIIKEEAVAAGIRRIKAVLE